MGQAISAGRARIQPDAAPFINLPKSLVKTLQDAIYEVAEGFGLSKTELKQVVHVSLHEYLRVSDDQRDECSDALFVLHYPFLKISF